jgi:hypothetical protein
VDFLYQIISGYAPEVSSDSPMSKTASEQFMAYRFGVDSPPQDKACFTGQASSSVQKSNGLKERGEHNENYIIPCFRTSYSSLVRTYRGPSSENFVGNYHMSYNDPLCSGLHWPMADSLWQPCGPKFGFQGARISFI